MYGHDGSGSAAVAAALVLAGLPHTVVAAASRAPGPTLAALQAANPLVQIPTLVFEDGTLMTESAAILIEPGLRQPASGLQLASRAHLHHLWSVFADQCVPAPGMPFFGGSTRRTVTPTSTSTPTMNPCLPLITALACLLSAVLPAHAALQDEVQVYDDSLNSRGEWGLELHLNTTPRGRTVADYPGEVLTHHGLRFTPELSYGLGHGLEAGLYLPAAINANGHADLAGLKLRLKWLPFETVDGHGAFGGVNVELSKLAQRYSLSRWSAEARFIAGWRSADWLLAANPTLGFDLSDGQAGGRPGFSLGLKAARRVLEGVAAGLELYSDSGPLGRPLPWQMQDNRVFVALDIDRKPWVLNLGVGRGLTDAADRWTVKAIFEVPFN